MQRVRQTGIGGPLRSPCLGPTARPSTMWAAAGSPGMSSRSSRPRAVTPRIRGMTNRSNGLQTLPANLTTRPAAECALSEPKVQLTAGSHVTALAQCTVSRRAMLHLHCRDAER